MTRIQDIATEICTNLELQVRVWRRLLDLSQAQATALRAQDVHSVHAILQEIEMAMLERSRSEVRRSMLITAAAIELGIPESDVTRDAIAARCDAALAGAMQAAAQELVELVGALDTAVARNTALLEQELAIIDVLVQGATLDRGTRTTYGKSGSQSEAPRLRLLDAQV